MDREKAMEMIGYHSDIEVKFEFYEDLVKEYFPGSSDLKGAEKKEAFFRLDSRLVDAGFSRTEEKREDDRCECKYIIPGIGAYVELKWHYLERYTKIWSDCHFLFLVIYFDQFSHDRFGENDCQSRGLYVHEFNDNTVLMVASFIRNLPQWEAEWEKLDIAGIHKEREQRLVASAKKCDALEIPVMALIRRIGLPYDILESYQHKPCFGTERGYFCIGHN